MVTTKYKDEPPGTHGEISYQSCTICWIEPKKFDRREVMTPAVHITDRSKSLAIALVVGEELKFVRAAFSEAEKRGLPNPHDVISRSLIQSAVVSYGRCFNGGKRRLDIDLKLLAEQYPDFSMEVHNYLWDLRNKHVAHSVNSFEIYEPIGVFLQADGEGIRDGAGVGATMKFSIGVSRAIILSAIDNIDAMLKFLENYVATAKIEVHQEFLERQKAGDTFEVAMLAKPLDRSAVKKDRPG